AVKYPSMGSVVSHELGPKNELPCYVCVPTQPNEFAGSGFLSDRFGPFSLGADPGEGAFRVRDLTAPAGVNEARMDRRRKRLDAVDAHFREVESSDAVATMDEFYQRAYKLLSSKQAREAFNLRGETEEMRKSYGQSAAGQRMLLCRRLVEAGVKFVSMTF